MFTCSHISEGERQTLEGTYAGPEIRMLFGNERRDQLQQCVKYSWRHTHVISINILIPWPQHWQEVMVCTLSLPVHEVLPHPLPSRPLASLFLPLSVFLQCVQEKCPRKHNQFSFVHNFLFDYKVNMAAWRRACEYWMTSSHKKAQWPQTKHNKHYATTEKGLWPSN